MTDFRAFVDESGDDPRERNFVMAAWVSSVQGWEAFSDGWVAELATSPAIPYFSNNDAFGLKGPFESWTPSARDEKVHSLISLLCKHRSNVYGAVVVVRHAVLSAIINRCLLDNRKLHEATRLAYPFHIAFHILLAEICKYQRILRCGEPIDFIFDERTGFLDECIAFQRKLRHHGLLPQQFLDIVGQIIPGNDKRLSPLQASDLLAGQVTASFRAKTATPFMRRIQTDSEVFVREIAEESSLLLDLDAIVTVINAVESTRILDSARLGD